MQQNPSPQPDDVGRKAGKNKRPRPWIIEWKWPAHWHKGDGAWMTYRSYRTEAERDHALEKFQRESAASTWYALEYRKKDP